MARIDLESGSLASSEIGVAGAYVDGRDGTLLREARFVSVAAPDCVVADALTKVVLVMGEDAAPLLQGFGAAAYLHAPGQGWSVVGGVQ